MTARRRGTKGEGTVYYDKTARRWAAVVTVKDPDTGRSRRVKLTARDRAGAVRLRRQLVAERDATGRLAPKDMTVGRLLDDFLARPPASWKSATTVRVNTDLAHRLRAGLGTILLSKLEPGDVDEHLRRQAAAGLARRTVRDQLNLLCRAVRRAQRRGLVAVNAAAIADMPGGASTRVSESMTVEQVNRLLSAGLDPLWRAWLATALMCGLRPGETGALSWADIGDDGVLHVRHSLHDSPGGQVPGPLKTESSRRSLDMPQEVTDALTAWRAEQLTQELAAGRLWQGTGLVFTDGYGRPLNRQRLNRGFRAACKAAGVARPDGTAFQPRECRHTFVSVLSASGVPIERISHAVGHINSGVTRSVYLRQISGTVSEAARVWDQIRAPGAPRDDTHPG
jgi:integrase